MQQNNLSCGVNRTTIYKTQPFSCGGYGHTLLARVQVSIEQCILHAQGNQVDDEGKVKFSRPE